MKLLPLRPSIMNPKYWWPSRLSKPQWDKLRRKVFERDSWTCRFCGHKGRKYMHVHHARSGTNNRMSNLVTCCNPCHVVNHIGLNLSLGLIEIWESNATQVQVVKATRTGIRSGKSLFQIKKELRKKYNFRRGPLPVRSISYANDLINRKSKNPTFSLPEPLCVIFTKIKQWNLEK